MNEFSIPLLAGEVNSILRKTKQQLRVPIEPQPQAGQTPSEQDIPFKVGDRIWIQENWAAHWSYNDVESEACKSETAEDDNYWYQADGVSNKGSQGCPASLRGTWRLADTMPKFVSRLHLTIEKVWIEQIQDISEDNAKAMGFVPEFFKNIEQIDLSREITAKDAFLEDWAQFRGATDLWTYAIEFSIDTDKSALHPSYLNDRESLHYQVKCAVKDTQTQHTEHFEYTTENKSLSCALEHVLVEEFKADFNALSADFNHIGEFFKLLDIESIRYIQEHNHIELSFEVRAQHKRVEIEVTLLSN
ncbi:hypothetical protein GCM10027155_03410 [Acinetobacter apis]|uniref:Uncharacterized protein n=1 Tax=Acinetobacter apis TaxID=1229165 RepID=A0A217EE20_9GAMM|nr:hypothetical protein [Acinetobacter apis]SNQ28426.1 hypothetical protein SAMN05444584_0346 [Acinetobacter apis]